MQCKVACPGEARPRREAEAVAKSTFERSNHESGIAQGQGPIAEPFRPSSIGGEPIEHPPCRSEALCNQLCRKLGISFEDDKRRYENSGIRDKGAIIASFWPMREPVIIRGKGRFEHMP